ncbi:hypothetical protein [Butyrivibrio sp. XBB1001]|uniref:hypothetical protein n=1 Tax=Butyrivibrio sp. XBB1001 TaxID=1280682 RepID=UPI000402616B|nr:hypothetical protein [Butyrivibrio sp. XBB1001]
MRIKRKKRKVRQFTIHILAVPAFSEDMFDVPHKQCAIILLTTRTTPFLDRTDIPKLVIDIIDVEDEKEYGAFRRYHAKRVIYFVRHLPKEVTDLYVSCSKGGSRSPGCAAAIMLMSGRSDKDVWLNPFYTPNVLVFKVLCREFGLFMPDILVAIRQHMNEQAYRKAQKFKNAGKYERWQILW